MPGISKSIGQIAMPLLDILYPRQCVVCAGSVEGEKGHLCWDCRSQFEWVQSPMCRICGDPVDGCIDDEFVCSWCYRSVPHFNAARSVVRFRGPARDALHGFKYSGTTWLVDDLAELLLAGVRVHYDQLGPDAVVSVPLFPRRERERTYNQSHLLAKRLAVGLAVPCHGACLRRTRDTQTQTTLKAAERRRNVHGAFVVLDAAWVAGRRLVLVDDVITTAATVNECARVLKRAGAASVHVLSVARG